MRQVFTRGKRSSLSCPTSLVVAMTTTRAFLRQCMEKYTGADIEILNKGGAGGMTGANEIFRSPGDGLTIGIINGSAMITNELAEIKGAAYKVAEYSYLGRVTADTRVMSTSVASGFNTYDSLKAVKSHLKWEQLVLVDQPMLIR